MVAVSFDHAFVFLKTRKTASTSIEMALEPFCRPAGAVIREETSTMRSRHGIVGRRLDGRVSRIDRLLSRTDWYNHMPAAAVRKALGEARWARLSKITSVRNPFEIAVSRYHWVHTRRGIPEAEDFAQVRADFRALLESGRWVIDVDHDVVHIDGRFVADHVVRFEHLADDLKRVVADIGLDPAAVHLPHTKPTSHRRPRPTADYFDDESVAIIRKTAAWAIERFGYPSDPRETSSEASREP